MVLNWRKECNCLSALNLYSYHVPRIGNASGTFDYVVLIKIPLYFIETVGGKANFTYSRAKVCSPLSLSSVSWYYCSFLLCS